METAASLISRARNEWAPTIPPPAGLVELAELQPESAAPLPHPCPVRFCTGLTALGAVCCPACWKRTPAAFRRAYYFAQRRVMHNRASREFVAEIVEHALRRLSAERTGESDLPGAGRLGELERQQADQLTRRCTSFACFQELIDAPAGSGLKLDCGKGWQPDPAQREANTQLADFYDREQAARKDPRRICRLGIAGL